MKIAQTLTTLALVCLSNTTLAGTYSLPQDVVARQVTSSVFHPDSSPDASGVDIKTDGQVIFFKEFRDGHRVETVIATLSADRLAALSNETSDLVADVALVKAKPNSISCMDAPSTTNLARNRQGEVVGLSAKIACAIYTRADKTYSSVPTILDGLVDLAYLR